MLVGSLPDPTSPGVVALISVIAGFLGTTYALRQDLPRDDIRWTTFIWGYSGVGFGLAVYCISLIIELY